ncbi:MAG TPA: class I SAM-dependent methyltransferase [Bradyrhizobium sp.]|jgi:SAM-dependent methyltransferase
MTSTQVSGTEGYAEEAEDLFKRYESIPAADTHEQVAHLIPASPSYILDIGAGTGRDAAWFAELGHRVVAVEPTDAMRLPAMKLHPQANIEWLDDSLPDLAAVRCRRELFDLIWLSAVWMHFDAAQRRQAMENLAALLRSGGAMIMRVRHGPVPPGRRMFEIPDAETIELAAQQGLQTVLHQRAESAQAANRDAGVSWTHLAFVRK